MPPRRQNSFPEELARALARSKQARDAFDALPPSHRREYAEWVAQAKKAETRERRARKTVAELTGRR
jgi:uncharacterized protein YdeI (YjbR/CyaY-like superfamily)